MKIFLAVILILSTVEGYSQKKGKVDPKDVTIDSLTSVTTILTTQLDSTHAKSGDRNYQLPLSHQQGVYSEPVQNHPVYNQDYRNNYNYHPEGYRDRYDQYYNNYYTYYETVQTTVTEPGYYENQTTLYLESNFYRVSDEMLVWSGQSEVVDASSVTSGAIDWAVVLVKGMIKYNAITP